MAAPNQGILDNANRADGGLGSNWSSPNYQGDASPTIVSNAIGQSGTDYADANWNVSTFTESEVYATLTALPADGNVAYLHARIQNAGAAGFDAYELRVSKVAGAANDTVALYRIIDNAETSLGSRTQEISAGDALSLVVLGTGATVTIQLWYFASGGSWAQLGADITDTSGSRITAAGRIGLGLQGNSARWDNFGGGEHSVSSVSHDGTISATAPTATARAYGTHNEDQPRGWADDPITWQRVTASGLYAGDVGLALEDAFFGARPFDATITATAPTPTAIALGASTAPAGASHDGVVVATATPATAQALGASTGANYGATTAAAAPAATAQAIGAVTKPAYNAVAQASAPTPIAVALGASGSVIYSAIVQATAPAATAAALGSRAASLRFYGTGTSQIDRAAIPLTQASGTQSRPVNVGAGDFTYEFWMRARYDDNVSYTPFSDARNSNIMLDRDIWNDSRGWVAGVRRVSSTLRMCFGVAGGGSWTTITGSVNVGDDAWHHIAIVRRQSTGVVEVYVDGALDANGTYTTGDLSYPLSYTPTGGTRNEYLVIGAEKHDAGSEYPSFNGFITELRISDTRRYTTTFTRPSAPFTTDANAVGLYHFDSAPGAVLRDASTVSGAPTNGELLTGGANNGPTWQPDSPFATTGHVGQAVAAAPAASAVAVGSITQPGYASVVSATAPAATVAAIGAATQPGYSGVASAMAGAATASAVGAVTQPGYAGAIQASAAPATALALGASAAPGGHAGIIVATANPATAQAVGGSALPANVGRIQATATAATASAHGSVGAGNVYLGQTLAVQPANLVDVWPLNETSGTTVAAFKTSADNGSYRSSVTPGTSWPTALGETQFVAPGLFPTTGDILLPAAALASKLNWDEGSVGFWIRATIAAWDEATLRRPLLIQVDVNNRIMIYRNAGADTLQAYYIGGGTTRSILVNNVTQRCGTGWLHITLTWSRASDVMVLLLNGEIAGSVTGLTAISGTLALFLLAGNPYFPNSTYAYLALWTAPLAQSDAEDLVDPVVRDRRIILEGDSLTVGGQAGATPYPKILARNLPWEIDQRTIAASGEKLSQMITDYAAQAEARYRPNSAQRNVLVLFGGANDIQNESVATAYSRLQTYWALARATGYWVVAVTLPAGNPSGSVNPYNSYRNSLNALILSDPSLYDAIARPDLNPNIGQDGDEANGTYFNADQLHLTTAGSTELATEVRAALLSSSATAVAVAPAATASAIGSATSPVYDGFVLAQAPIALASATGASSGPGAYVAVAMVIAPGATAHAIGVFALGGLGSLSLTVEIVGSLGLGVTPVGSLALATGSVGSLALDITSE